MYYHEYVDEILPADIAEAPAQNFYVQAKWLLVAFMLLMPGIIFVSVPTEYVYICLLAYLNFSIIVFFSWRFIRKGTLAAMIPVLSLSYAILAWPTPIILFGIFYPTQAYYSTLSGYHFMFEAGVKVQLCVLLFLAGYLPTVSLALRNDRYIEPKAIIQTKSFGYVVAILATAVLFFHGFSKIVRVPTVAAYLAEGFHKYLNGLVFIVGALLRSFPKAAKITILVLIGITVLFYTVGNNRSWAVLCVAFLTLGIVFYGGYSRKTKLVIIICLALAFPLYVTIANVTREAIGTVGFEEGFQYRLGILREWRQLSAERSAAAFTFGRMFHGGGHAIISMTPEKIPYRLFRVQLFIPECFEALLPGRLVYRPYYRGTHILLDYGFNIIEGKTSTEVSMIGNFWSMGGWLPVIFGSIALGLWHGFLVKILQRCWRASEMKALVYFSVLLPFLFWTSNWDFITHWRTTIYGLGLATIIYWFLKLFITEQRREESSIEEEPTYVL